jgi:hypothetical protein
MVQGDTFSYTVLSAYGEFSTMAIRSRFSLSVGGVEGGNVIDLISGLFYGGYGAMMLPSLGIVEAYGGYTPQYYNSFGFYLLRTYLASNSSPL